MVYITVKYGESESAIFNPNCKTFLLLKNIRHKCKCEREADIELSDESGNIKNLRDPGFQNRYANEFLDERENLVLLKVERQQSESGNVSYTPMLHGVNAILSEEFMYFKRDWHLWIKEYRIVKAKTRLAIKGSEQSEHRRVKSNTRRREKAQLSDGGGKEMASRQSSRERPEKTKSDSKGKRLSAKSKK